MFIILFFLICFFASVIGAICGIGGGVIIKPVLDAFQMMDVSTISLYRLIHDNVFRYQKQDEQNKQY